MRKWFVIAKWALILVLGVVGLVGSYVFHDSDNIAEKAAEVLIDHQFDDAEALIGLFKKKKK